MTDRPGFLGFPRSDGRVGVRNHVLVVPTVICASVVCERIAEALPASVVALPHLAGCGQLGPDMHATHSTLAAYCTHPNVAAVLVVALGCEQVIAETLLEAARSAGKPAEAIAIQAEGGTLRTIGHGRQIAERLAKEASRMPREWCDIGTLVLSLKCGGSDYTSGLAANPALGRVADRAVQVFGGMGYSRDLPVERLYRDARVYRIFDGTSEIHRGVVARGVLKRGASLVDLVD